MSDDESKSEMDESVSEYLPPPSSKNIYFPYPDNKIDFFYRIIPSSSDENKMIIEIDNKMSTDIAKNKNDSLGELWKKFKIDKSQYLIIFPSISLSIFNWILQYRASLSLTQRPPHTTDHHHVEYLNRIYPASPRIMYRYYWNNKSTSKNHYYYSSKPLEYPSYLQDVINNIINNKNNPNDDDDDDPDNVMTVIRSGLKNLNGDENENLMLLTHLHLNEQEIQNLQQQDEKDQNLNKSDNVYCGDIQAAWEFAYFNNEAGNYEKCNHLYDIQSKLIKYFDFKMPNDPVNNNDHPNVVLQSDSKRSAPAPVSASTLDFTLPIEDRIDKYSHQIDKLLQDLNNLKGDYQSANDEYNDLLTYAEQFKLSNFELNQDIQSFERLTKSLMNQINNKYLQYQKAIQNLINVQTIPKNYHI